MSEEKLIIPPGIKLMYISAGEEEEEEMLCDFCADGGIVEMEPVETFANPNGVLEVVPEQSFVNGRVSSEKVIPFHGANPAMNMGADPMGQMGSMNYGMNMQGVGGMPGEEFSNPMGNPMNMESVGTPDMYSERNYGNQDSFDGNGERRMTWYEKNQQRMKESAVLHEASEEKKPSKGPSKGLLIGLIAGGAVLAVILIILIVTML